jgi:hypothetical protein
MKRRVEFFKNKMPYIPFTKLANTERDQVPRKRRPFMTTS